MPDITLPCGHTVAESWLISRAMSIQAKRSGNGGAKPGAGRKKKLKTCPACGSVGGTAEMRGHKCASDQPH